MDFRKSFLFSLLMLGLSAEALASETLYTHAFSPHALFVTGSGWTPELIRNEFKRVQEIYNQCQIRVDLQEIHEVTGSEERLSLLGQSDLEIVEELNIPNRPLVGFAGLIGVSYSHGDEFSPLSLQKALTNTSWLGWEIETQEYKKDRDPSYSPVAHELAHVLCNCGHVASGERNLLSGHAHDVNAVITPQQCETFRHSPLVRELK